jgi:hypothetical protein
MASLEPLIDALLAAPAIHRLIADAEVAGDVADTSAGSDQVKNPLAKFPREAPSSHAVLLIGQQHDIPVIRLHETQGALIELLLRKARPELWKTPCLIGRGTATVSIQSRGRGCINVCGVAVSVRVCESTSTPFGVRFGRASHRVASW